ncbi:MAG TPA: hypothetical protein VMU90_13945 [Solirubrobacteraceae bacterium]|nr:hypothetical protein [Solirubrobacteraceae bacterium]
MSYLGYVIALVLAVLLAAGASYLVDQQFPVGRSIYLFILAFVGLFAGSRLFGAFGTQVHYLSFIGPSTGGFYWITGLIGGVVLVGAALLTMQRQAAGMPTDMESEGIHDPKIAHLLFADARSAPVWFGIRLYIGYEWLAAGFAKMTGAEKGFMGGGTGLEGYWKSVTAVPATGKSAITYGWWRDFLTFMLNHHAYTWFAPLISIGEFLVGLGLIVGCLVGFAAFFGAVMNFSYMLAGSASTNPVLFALAIALILGWKVAGYWGFDRVLLPVLGAPWSPGKAFSHAGTPAHRGTPSPA